MQSPRVEADRTREVGDQVAVREVGQLKTANDKILLAERMAPSVEQKSIIRNRRAPPEIEIAGAAFPARAFAFA